MITIEASIQPEVIIRGKKDKLSRAFINVIDNAIRYTPSSGKVHIRLSKTKDVATLQIKDTGAGIYKNDLPHIFDRYYRGSKTDKTFGSGLGLSIAKAIISAHHGQIQAQSQIGKGSDFTISLPLASS